MRMQRARRLASVAVSATLALAGLAACRSAPDVAVYYGQSGAISVADVQRVYDDARDRLTAARAGVDQQVAESGQSAPALEPVRVPFSNVDVVSNMVGHELATRAARERNVTLPAQLPLEQAGQSIGLPADAEYTRLYTETRVLIELLTQNGTAASIADADLRAIYDQVAVMPGIIEPGTSFDQFKQTLPAETQQGLARSVEVRDQLQAQHEQLDVRVNPRYSSAELTIFAISGQDQQPLTLIGLPLSEDAESPVLDAS